MALRLQVMPEEEMGLRLALHDLTGHSHPGLDALPLLPAGLRQGDRSVIGELVLPVPVHFLAVVIPDNVGPDLQRRQVIAGIVIAQVGGPPDEERPGRDPQPELILLVGIEGQVVGLGAVPLEKPGQRLAGVHDL